MRILYILFCKSWVDAFSVYSALRQCCFLAPTGNLPRGCLQCVKCFGIFSVQQKTNFSSFQFCVLGTNKSHQVLDQVFWTPLGKLTLAGTCQIQKSPSSLKTSPLSRPSASVDSTTRFKTPNQLQSAPFFDIQAESKNKCGANYTPETYPNNSTQQRHDSWQNQVFYVLSQVLYKDLLAKRKVSKK